MPGEPLVAVENLTTRYGDTVILEKVSFQVKREEIFIVLGGSGCGKSTLLKHLIGLLKPAGGRIIINGVDIVAAEEEELRQVQKQIGVLFQADALFGAMTLFENIALPLTEYTDLPPETIARLVRLKLSLVNLAGYEHHMPSELSGGMRKRAGIARAMALDPVLLFFDEPWAGLDPVTAAELDILIKSINAALGTTMVIVTQELASIFGVGQRVIMLDKEARGVIAVGTPQELRENSQDERVVNFFNRRPRGPMQEGR